MQNLLRTVKPWIRISRTVFFAINFVFACVITILFLCSWDYSDTLIYMEPNNQRTTSEYGTSSPKEFQHIKICTQDQRKQIITEICKKYPKARQGPKGITFLVDHKNKIAYCTVQKSGCSTWKLIMANMSSGGAIVLDKDGKPPIGVHTLKFYRHYGLKFTHYKTTNSALRELKDYTKFTVIRHPLNRLLSGFYDKTRNDKYIKIAPFLNKYRSYADYDIIMDDPRKLPTFAEFASMVVNDNDRLSKDRHWRPADDLCDICNVDYQYILKLESMESNLPQFISEVYYNHSGNAHTNQTLNNDWLNSVKLNSHTNKNSKIKPSMLNEYSTLDSNLFHKVIDKFSYGIDAFGYSFDKSTFIATCGHSNSSVDYCC